MSTAPNADYVLSPGSWLSARAWLDPDRKHVWLAHDCTTARVTTMLPWPMWHSTGLRMEPSFSCAGCGIHTFAILDVPDEEYRCIATFSRDGRRCEEMRDHGPLHHSGLVSWGSYAREGTR